MQRQYLENILKWAHSTLSEGDFSINEFYQYMKLIDALTEIIEILPPTTMPQIVSSGSKPYLRVVQ
jgi:hypothetical protein